jgi:predicted transcriptional regulator
MTKLLEQALQAVQLLPPEDQDEIASVIMQLAGTDPTPPVPLSAEERDAIARSKKAADRGEFATDEELKAVWAKHGL